MHNYSVIAIVVCVSEMVTAAQAAERLGVNPSRVRALIAAGALTATRAGRQWLVDVHSIDRQYELTVAGATGRPFAPRIAWAAAALCDSQRDGLGPNERARLRRRLAGVDIKSSNTCAQVQRWLARRALSVCRYRIGERDITELLGANGVLATGISTVEAYDLGLGTGGFADAYVDERVHRKLVKDFILIDSARGNLTLRTTDSRLSDGVLESKVAPRLIAGVDLAEDTDARTRAAGCTLVSHALRAVHAPRRG
ncbi:DNA-binding protein [Mycobacterium avium]|uniref:DNA-binding protein n=2 Tax=Mycobacterium avium TaxID=1764 RepID=A0A3B6X924_MYCAV|nr:DNA-binding protein [Mycobacterium avium subsp. hominissuis]PBA71597.1 DNA-binding protein [Mycobacterium avium]